MTKKKTMTVSLILYGLFLLLSAGISVYFVSDSLSFSLWSKLNIFAVGIYYLCMFLLLYMVLGFFRDKDKIRLITVLLCGLMFVASVLLVNGNSEIEIKCETAAISSGSGQVLTVTDSRGREYEAVNLTDEKFSGKTGFESVILLHHENIFGENYYIDSVK